MCFPYPCNLCLEFLYQKKADLKQTAYFSMRGSETDIRLLVPWMSLGIQQKYLYIPECGALWGMIPIITAKIWKK